MWPIPIDKSPFNKAPAISDSNIHQTPRVCIVEDDADVADSLQALFVSRRIEVDTYEDARSFLGAWTQTVLRFEPAVFIFDHSMPEMSGHELFLNLRSLGLALFQPVIFLSGSSSLPTAVSVMRSGAFDFVQKPFIDEAFLTRVSSAMSVAQQTYPWAIRAWKFEAQLTDRERLVARRVAEGYSSREIADEFGLSARTVDAHRTNIYSKLAVSSSIELVAVINSAWRQVARNEAAQRSALNS